MLSGAGRPGNSTLNVNQPYLGGGDRQSQLGGTAAPMQNTAGLFQDQANPYAGATQGNSWTPFAGGGGMDGISQSPVQGGGLESGMPFNRQFPGATQMPGFAGRGWGNPGGGMSAMPMLPGMEGSGRGGGMNQPYLGGGQVSSQPAMWGGQQQRQPYYGGGQTGLWGGGGMQMPGRQLQNPYELAPPQSQPMRSGWR